MVDHKPSSSETDLTISAHKASDTATQNLADQAVKMSGIWKGEATSVSTWDEFPNGRFGDFKSPAYGVQDPWGGPVSHPVRRFPSHISFSFFSKVGCCRRTGLLRNGADRQPLTNSPLCF